MIKYVDLKRQDCRLVGEAVAALREAVDAYAEIADELPYAPERLIKAEHNVLEAVAAVTRTYIWRHS